ncbi:HNH endonuclease [Methanorbis furvi]|uniref:HNH nuclease domain-containing protein n=1 Tax=Methanorbis furvi TaxID=3028299 RepID=A0AAE4SAI1_9EURY|nr:hypothetical protein [Methanocorpusculaceae archaeon Ag1]
MTLVHQPVPGIHLGDYLACEKYTSGQWIFDLSAGEIYSRRTGGPVPFRKQSNGYLTTSVLHKGVRTDILKHRAIWVVANIRFGLPVDASLEIDHINHNKTDCRIQNLRLVTHLQNERAKPTALSPETVRTIRKLYAAGGVTQERLAVQFGISRHSVSRIIRWVTYTEVETDD